jgi:hypothetical protein
MLLVQTSCLVPQSIDQFDADAGAHPAPRLEIENIPPYLLSPLIPTLYRQGPADAAANPPCTCHLQLWIPTVQEADPFITLEARWFVDYDPAVPASTSISGTPEDLHGATTSVSASQERSLSPFNFDAVSQGITTNGTHIVELVVADTNGFKNTPNTARPNRTFNPDFLSSEYRFVVNVNLTPDPNQPTCPNVLPSVRVCQ